MATTPRPLAIVTGASVGIGLELAKCCARDGFDLIIAADLPLDDAARELQALGASVETVQTDLAREEGIQQLYSKVEGRPVDALLANAGHGLGGAFLDQDLEDFQHVIDTNISGTLSLIHKVGRNMRARNKGRILIVGSIAGFLPGAFQAVYNGSKAFLDSFAWALRNELNETEVTVTCLMPGATETDFFERANMEDTKVGSQPKDDVADVAQTGYDAMMKGKTGVVTGFMNKLQVAAASVLPSSVTAEMHRKQAEPGTGQ